MGQCCWKESNNGQSNQDNLLQDDDSSDDDKNNSNHDTTTNNDDERSKKVEYNNPSNNAAAQQQSGPTPSLSCSDDWGVPRPTKKKLVTTDKTVVVPKKSSFMEAAQTAIVEGKAAARTTKEEKEEEEVAAYETIDDDNTDNLTSINPHAYISSIEQHILTHHSSSSSETFHLQLKPEHQKPILQHLLEIPSKAAFSQLLRIFRKETEFTKMATFTRDILQPSLHSLSEEVRNEKLPNVDGAIELVLKGPASKGMGVFDRIATGRLYKGKLVELIRDLAPDLVPVYQNVMVPLTDADVFTQVVDSVSQERKRNGNGLDPVNILAARNCIQYFSSLIDDATEPPVRSSAHNSGRSNGIKCEELCVAWLQQQRHNRDTVVLPNVNVSPKSPSKYALAMERTDASNEPATGILWTNTVRNKA